MSECLIIHISHQHINRKDGNHMPRGRKKAVPVETVVEPVVEATIVEEPKEKAKKPYPSYDERIAAAEQQIAKLEALNASRKALIEKTEKTLEERRDALAKSEAALEKAVAKRDRLIASKDKPAKAPSARAAKAAEKAQYDELMAAIKASGKSVEELIASLK